MESGVARVAATKMTAEAAEKLDELMDIMEAHAGEPDVFHKADVELHDTIAGLVQNPFLTVVLDSLRDLGEAARAFVCTVPGAPEQAIEDHRQIISALKASDPDAASSAVRNHLENVMDFWRSAKAHWDHDEVFEE